MTVREFEILAVRLRPRLLQTALRVLQDEAAAEDVVQDTLLKLWTIRGELEAYTSVEALGCTIAYRLAINALRNERRGAAPVDLAESIPADDSADSNLARAEQRLYVDRILASLPPAQATLLRLRHIEGYDGRSIAALLGTSEGAVRTALSRARHAVAASFNIDPNL